MILLLEQILRIVRRLFEMGGGTISDPSETEVGLTGPSYRALYAI
jgi:hypothetical protein